MKLKFFLLRVTFFLIVATQFSCTEITTNEPGALAPKTVDQDATLPSISVNGTMLHAETFGNLTIQWSFFCTEVQVPIIEMH